MKVVRIMGLDHSSHRAREQSEQKIERVIGSFSASSFNARPRVVLRRTEEDSSGQVIGRVYSLLKSGDDLLGLLAIEPYLVLASGDYRVSPVIENGMYYSLLKRVRLIGPQPIQLANAPAPPPVFSFSDPHEHPVRPDRLGFVTTGLSVSAGEALSDVRIPPPLPPGTTDEELRAAFIEEIENQRSRHTLITGESNDAT